MPNIQQMLDDGQRIFVRNRTGRFQDKQGVWILQVRDRDGNGRPIEIPATRFPFELTGRMPHSALAECQDLYDALDRRCLELVDEETALAELNADGGLGHQVINQNVRRFQPTRRKIANVQDAANGVEQEPDPNEFADSEEEEIVQMLDKDELDINPKIRQICEDIAQDEEVWEEKWIELRGMEPEEISDDDLGYLMTQVGNKRILEWAKSELASRQDEEKPIRRKKRRTRKKK